jgi:DNA-binding transcriptional MerR regulator
MPSTGSFTLSEIARRLDVPQHKLIHLCEKGVVVPEIHDAAGRGSSRVCSANNFLELAVAVRLREMMLPVSVVGAMVHVLRRFGEELRQGSDPPSLPESLRGPRSPELRIILSDGKAIFFSLASTGQKASVFGGVPVAAVLAAGSAWDGTVEGRSTKVTGGNHPFGGPEGSEFARMELSVTSVARALPLD